jgi:hypothetical protein
MSVGLKDLNRKLLNLSKRTLYFATIVRVSTQQQGNVLHGSKEQQNHSINNAIADLEKQLNCKIVVRKQVEDTISGGEAPRLVGGGSITARRLYDLLKSEKIRGGGKRKDKWNQFPDRQDENGFVEFKYGHPPVVPPELATQVDEALRQIAKEHLKYGKMATLLSGVLFTSGGLRLRCGGGNSDAGRYRYYENRESNISIPKDKIEAVIIDRVRQLQNFL